MIQGYSDYIGRKMNQQELMAFNAKLFGKPQEKPFEIEIEEKSLLEKALPKPFKESFAKDEGKPSKNEGKPSNPKKP